MLSTCQIRAARAILRWSAKDLALASGIGISTIRRLELEDGVPAANIRTLEALKTALERAGIEFIGSPSEGAGVRLRGKTQDN